MRRTLAAIFFIALCVAAFGQEFQIKSPVGGENWRSGAPHDITWTYSGFTAGTKVRLLLFQNGVKLGIIADNLEIGVNGTGTYPAWPAGAYAGTTAPAGSGYKVRIRRVGSAEPHGESPNGFAIFNMIHLQVAKALALKKDEPPPIHSSGTVIIHKNLVCDLDSGHESSAPGCDDFWWMQNSNPPYQRLFIPCPGAYFKPLGVWADSSWAVLHDVNFPSQQNPILDADLPLNMVVAYFTNYGRRGALRVTGKGADSSLTIAWVTYGN